MPVATMGLVNATKIHVRELFADAIMDRVCVMSLAHNHPSGLVEPSKQDISITKQLSRIGTKLGIEVLDCIF